MRIIVAILNDIITFAFRLVENLKTLAIVETVSFYAYIFYEKASGHVLSLDLPSLHVTIRLDPRFLIQTVSSKTTNSLIRSGDNITRL